MILQPEEIIVYTAIFGNRDNLIDPVPYPGCQYVCFTDNPYLTSKVWHIRLVTRDEKECPRMNAKHYKLFPHLIFPHHQYSLWIDGSIQLLANVKNMVESLLVKNDLACFVHPWRNCIYEEAQEVISAGLSNVAVVTKQMDRYRSEGFAEKQGLLLGGALLRRHSKVIKSLMTDWWEEIQNGSIRDQLSFAYVCWRSNFKFTIIPGTIYDIATNLMIMYIGHKGVRHAFKRNGDPRPYEPYALK